MKKYLILLIFLLGRVGTLFAQTNDTLITHVPKELKIWKTITIGDGKTIEELVSLLEKKKYIIYYKSIILETFTTQNFLEDINLVKVTPQQLGISKSYSFATLYKAAKAQGLEICPKEIVLRLALQNCFVQIATEPVALDSILKSLIFAIDKKVITFAIDSTESSIVDQSLATREIIFQISKKTQQEQVVLLPKSEIASNATLSVSSGVNTLKVWDDGTVDGDIVDIYIDNVLQKRDVVLSNKPLIIPITVSQTSSIDFIVKNEGSKPPCTMRCFLEEIKESFTLHGKVDKQLNITLKAK